MAIPHATAGEPVDVRPLGVTIASRRTAALFKSRDLEVVRLVLLAGQSLPPHRVPGEITIQCLEGRLAVDLDAGRIELSAGELLFLEGNAMHGVTGLEDASALLTIALDR